MCWFCAKESGEEFWLNFYTSLSDLVARVLIRLPVTISASSSCGLGTDMDWQEERVSVNYMLSPLIQPPTK